MLWTLRNVRDRTCLCYIYFKKKSSGESYIFYVFIPLEDFFWYKCLQPFIFLKFDAAG